MTTTLHPSASPLLSATLLVALLSLLLSRLSPYSPTARNAPPLPLLPTLAERQFAWGSSTTDVPISSVSVLAKHLLAGRDRQLPPGLRAAVPRGDTLRVQHIRDFTNAARLRRVHRRCHAPAAVCDFDAADARFGLTPLHLAAASGDAPLAAYLQARGAVPVADHVARLPRNLTFEHFIANSKRWARAAGRHDCDLPVVTYDGSRHAMSEVRRLVSEGEPVLIRGAFSHFSPLEGWSVSDLVEQFGDTDVTVGHVPYARAFNLSINTMSLREYYDKYVSTASATPMYVFNKGAAICERGYKALMELLLAAFPMPELIASPDEMGALDSIHFFMGQKGSGAPFHIHADAINAAVTGSKHWYIFTPARTLYSRKTIKRWVEEDLESLPEQDRPLECIQRPGDVIYVPLDWGHAVLNLDDDTFGYALEVLNKRDTLSHIWR